MLSASRYGKGRVRIMRVRRGDERHEVSELSINVILHGEFERAYTAADNRNVVATDTIKNIVNVVAREHVAAAAEPFCGILANRYLDLYTQVGRVSLTAYETRWSRMQIGGAAHPHGFVLDANGRPTVQIEATRDGSSLRSGLDGFSFMKSTGSGWVDYVQDEYTTLAETRDRIAATSMNASWLWSALPAEYPGANERVLRAMLEVFASTYSHSLQDSLYRMGEAALGDVPEISEIVLACPNKHYLPIDLSRFGLASDNLVFTPTDEPHGQIECTIRR
jgi:urate oxidase